MTISEQVLDMTVIPIPSLPGSNKKQILMAQQTTVELLLPGESAGHIRTLRHNSRKMSSTRLPARQRICKEYT
jgi:hypothetical protein